MVSVQVVAADAIDVDISEGFISGARQCSVQTNETAHEDAFELRRVHPFAKAL